MKIELLTENHDLLALGIDFFWMKWGSETNFAFYKDCIEHSTSSEKALPKFYVLVDKGEIIGSYALLTNDLISRQDLFPWLACLFIEEAYRNQGLAAQLLDHSLNEAKKRGFDALYLSTDLEGFYEQKGWTYFSTGYNPIGDSFKIYAKQVK